MGASAVCKGILNLSKTFFTAESAESAENSKEKLSAGVGPPGIAGADLGRLAAFHFKSNLQLKAHY